MQKWCVFLLTCLLSVSAFAQSGFFQDAAKKQDEKKTSRWSLSDWLAQKERIRMSDMWLARNSHSSLFEFFIEGHALNYNSGDGSKTGVTTNENNYGGAIAAYAGVAGLRGSYDSDSEERSTWTGSFNIRLLGQALQDTHINLEYGLRGSKLDGEKFQNQFGAVSTNIYITKTFGLEGSYQKILSGEADSHRKLEGESSKAGVFIDFAFIRFFGSWQNELLHFNGGSQSDVREKREGYGGGIRFYF